jgi:N-methylhydantoinase A
MASAARVHAVENGKDTSGRTLIAFGGAAPLHAARLAQKLGIRRVVVPVDAGVGSAHGFLEAPVAYEVVRTRLVRLDALDRQMIGRMFDEMRAEAEAVVRQGAPEGRLTESRTAFMRYRGQGHEVAVPLPDGELDAAALRGAFDATYAKLYGRTIPRLEIEAVSWTLALAQQVPLPHRDAEPLGTAAAPEGQVRMIDAGSGGPVTAAVFTRAALRPGARLQGPAVVTEPGTSTIIPPGHAARIGASGDIIIEESGA